MRPRRFREQPCAALPPAQGLKGVAEVVLRHRPSKRDALAGVFQQRRLEGRDGVLEARRAALPLAQGLKGVAEVPSASQPKNGADCDLPYQFRPGLAPRPPLCYVYREPAGVIWGISVIQSV